VNYGSDAILIDEMVAERWYHVRAEVMLTPGALQDSMNIYVDGHLSASGLTPKGGAITGVRVVGFAFPGTIYMDNLYGAPIKGATWVSIDTPAPGGPMTGAVTGTVPIDVSASADVTRVDLFVDGQLTASDTTVPFHLAWNSAVNPLRGVNAPGHDLAYGYYFADGRFGDYRREVNDYTNLYFAWTRVGYEASAEAPNSQWLDAMEAAVASAVAQGRRITLELNLQEDREGRVTPLDDVIKMMCPYWASVERVELADEPNPAVWTQDHTEDVIRTVNASIDTNCSKDPTFDRPLGIDFGTVNPLPPAVHAEGLSWVGIEGYLDGPGDPISQVNIDRLNQQLTTLKSQALGLPIVIVGQSYTRNTCWANVDNVRDLQPVTYAQAAADPNVLQLQMFAFARATGAHDNPELTEPQLLAGEDLLHRTFTSAKRGLRTISVRGTTASGAVAWARRTVTVDGPMIHVGLTVPGNSAGQVARVIHKPDPATYSWTMTGGGAITGGAATDTITFTSGAPGGVMDLAVNESYFGARTTHRKVMAEYLDVPLDSIFHDWIANITINGVAGGCGGGNFCPSTSTTREQMAVFLVVAKQGVGYTPPPATGIFFDVPPSSPYARWIEQLYRWGVVGGCTTNPLRYCPTDPVTREQMAVFLLMTLDQSGTVPPPATGIFSDVPPTSGYAKWIEELYRRGITGGCATNPLRYCPADPVTRGAMAPFLVATFGLAFP
jgi:hypothetical protein